MAYPATSSVAFSKSMPGRDLFACAAPLLFVAVLTPACGGNGTGPTPIGTQSTITLMSTTPAQGSTLTPTGTLPGTFFARGSGEFGVTVTITAGQDLPFAQLAVFLLTTTNASGYCGQNLPDWPTWRPFARGRTVTYTVTGFQVFSLPCEVTGIRAVFNTREDLHLGGVPPASFIVADTTLPVVYHLRSSGS
jgi:hypothetical protein